MSHEHDYVVLLAGGEGTRFAPLSTPDCPKQFLRILDSQKTMMVQTYERVAPLVSQDHVYVSTNARYRELVRKNLPWIYESQILGEPVKKNTAPAMVLMTHWLTAWDPEAVILFVPSDHYIHDVVMVRESYLKALEFAKSHDYLVTFGIPPSFPSTEYGYIETGLSIGTTGLVKAQGFVEKPNEEKAVEYLQSGRYVWNSGMFAWKGQTFLKMAQTCLPDMIHLLKEVPVGVDGLLPIKAVTDFFTKAQSISIDYGVMEKAASVAVLPLNAGWSDVGTWNGLAALTQKYHLTLAPEVQRYLQA